MVVNYICLLMVQAKKQQINIEIQSFLTVFTWFLFIPIFYTAAENLVGQVFFIL